MGNNLFGIGFGELVFLAILALIVFGPKRLPEAARTIGRFLQQVRQATSGVEEEMRRLVAGEEDPATWLGAKSPQGPAAFPPSGEAVPFSSPPDVPGARSAATPPDASPRGLGEGAEAQGAGLAAAPHPDASSKGPGEEAPTKDDGPVSIPPRPAG